VSVTETVTETPGVFVAFSSHRSSRLATHHNKWGFRGIEKVRDKFRAVLGNKVWRSQYFDTVGEAAAAYDREARRRYGELAYLNFPKRGERKVEPIDEDYCAHGHSRALHSYIRPDGRAGYCRLCNKQAQKRSAARRGKRGHAFRT